MATLVIGANGKVGRLVVQNLVAAGEAPLCMIRDAKQAAGMRERGGEPVPGDLEGDFDAAFEAADRVVFAAGSGAQTGGDKTLLVDLWGAIKTMDVCRKYGIERYVMVSSLKAADPDNGPERLRHYLVAKHLADDYLERSGLAYTIVRAGGLTDEPGTGRVRAERFLGETSGKLSRADLATLLVACLATDGTIGKTFDAVAGNTPIGAALAAL